MERVSIIEIHETPIGLYLLSWYDTEWHGKYYEYKENAIKEAIKMKGESIRWKK